MSETQLIWLDGAPATSLPLPDRGLDFGDGLFETLLLKDGRALFADLHAARLRRGCERLALPDCVERFLHDIESFGAGPAAVYPWVALRATVTRGAGPRGYAPPTDATPRILLSATPMGRDALVQLPPARAVEVDHKLSLQPALAGIKHLNRLEQVIIANEVRDAGADEGIVYDRKGRLVCVASGNIFLVIDGVLHTPELGDCGIAGTRRQLIIEWLAPALGLEVVVRELRREDLLCAEAAFMSNSLVGIRTLGKVGELELPKHHVAKRLFAEYAKSCA